MESTSWYQKACDDVKLYGMTSHTMESTHDVKRYVVRHDVKKYGKYITTSKRMP